MVIFSAFIFVAQAIFAPADFHYFSGEREECEFFLGYDPYETNIDETANLVEDIVTEVYESFLNDDGTSE